MKKIIAMVLCVVLALSVAGCGKDSYRMGILIPAENTDGYLWADEEVSPKGRKLTVTSDDEFGQIEFILKPVEAKEENAYEPIIIEQGKSVTIDVEKGAWFKVGIRMLNNAVPEKVKYLEIKGATIRIASGDERNDELPDICVMTATIIEIGNGTMLVEPEEGSWELSSCDRFSVPIEHMNASPEPMVGDIIEITYDGSIEETYPASLGNITHIEVVGTTVVDICPRVTINGITYYDRGNNPLKAGLPPADFSVYEESELPVEGAIYGTVTAYAVCDDAAYLLINDEWYEFIMDGSEKDYIQKNDGTWEYEGYTYKYRLEITGRMNNAASDSTFVYLSNIEAITFDQAWKAAGFSSNIEDYFDVKDAILVESKVIQENNSTDDPAGEIQETCIDGSKSPQILETEIASAFLNMIVSSLNERGYDAIVENVDQEILRGARYVLSLSGSSEARIIIYLYDNSTLAKEDVLCIDKGGGTITLSDQTHYVTWKSIPHFYYQDIAIIQYVGTDNNILSLLSSLFGEQFAGGSDNDTENTQEATTE